MVSWPLGVHPDDERWGAGSCRRVQSLDWVSLNQSYHPAPLYSVKGMHDVLPVEYGQKTFYRSGSVARPGLNIFPQDASSVFKGSQNRLLVWIIHDTAQLLQQNGRGALDRLAQADCLPLRVALCPL
jgi:hypothetical protein